ncbi:MAG: hypothetical protein NT013_16615 [Planctomycetia bacterium]|nr:hypothetical protein [Planctomycetia bacterium]
MGVATDGHGKSDLSGRVEYDGMPRTSSSPVSDIHIVKYDRTGTLRWFQQAGSDRTDHAYTIV